MSGLRAVIQALTAEGECVDRLVADLDPAQWHLPTPAPGWTITHQVGHLSFVFRIAGLAAADPSAFTQLASRIGAGFDAAVNAALAEYTSDPPEVLLARWRSERDNAIKALATVPDDQLVPWLVNPLPPAVLASAGMMELFAHGQDIADTLGVVPEYTDRIAPVATFVARTWDFAYQARELPVPAEPFRFELTVPSGAVLTFGPQDAVDRITGPAVDLCLLATRRRHPADLAVTATGAAAEHWLDIAQCYRGPAGAGRQPGQFDH